jgi:hypothetical protein
LTIPPLANPGLPPPDPITDVNHCREAFDEGAVQVEERADAWSG